MIVKRYANFVE